MANGPVVWRSGDSPGVPPGSLFLSHLSFQGSGNSIRTRIPALVSSRYFRTLSVFPPL
jgi:hypothetical protein